MVVNVDRVHAAVTAVSLHLKGVDLGEENVVPSEALF